MPTDATQDVTIALVTHDLQKKVSYVTLVWNRAPDKRLGLPIPFATKLEDVKIEALKAVQDFAAELTHASMSLPE